MSKHKRLFSLINAANIQSGLLKQNFVQSATDFRRFEDISLGIPILVPADNELFYFKRSDVFQINEEFLLSTIYSHSDASYVGFKHSSTGTQFLSSFSVKDDFKDEFNRLVEHNLATIAHVRAIRKNQKKIGAFQTRNIPHFGHEEIIWRMLTKCEHLVVNPVIGPKKKGDVTVECLSLVFSEYFAKKYSNKISFNPIFANMFYAGPREAIHHARMRKTIGYDLFSVGRDHAGAEKKYPSQAAAVLAKSLEKIIDIEIMCHLGSVFCNGCGKVILGGDCAHSGSEKKDISGTEFRTNIKNGTIYELADKGLQKFLHRKVSKVFE